jgi:hypothetical protein
VKPKGAKQPVCPGIYLLTKQEAEHLFLSEEAPAAVASVAYSKTQEAGPLRQITIGVQKVAEEPTDDDFNAAAVYRIPLTGLEREGLLSIDYRGDCARLYALSDDDNQRRLVADNFYYGRPMLYGLWRLPEGYSQLELRILPLQADAPVYLPREAERTPGERVNKIEVIPFNSVMKE